MFEARARGRNAVNVWPGYVDILASLLLVFVFVLTIFMVAQHYLSAALAGRTSALQELQREIQELADVLTMERTRGSELARDRDRLRAELAATVGERDDARRQHAAAAAQVESLAARLAQSQQALDAARRETAEVEGRLAEQSEALTRSERRAASAAEEVALLNRQLAALREQLTRLEAALEVAETTVARQQVQLEELGHKLNVALADKVQELQRYRSEFFGRLRAVLGERPDIRIVGDRFVFQSELFFPTASAELGEAGKRQLAQVADALTALARQIPADIDWVLQVEGHTDLRPISTAEFPSNWELSTARANSIVHYLIERGIPPERLAAAGFAAFQPVDSRRTDEAFRRNRRIELKFTSR